ncbi:MAG: LPXTG cell wall anchor domain-containing protein [Nanoarchaeota archaeon]|nr:LPXTG cell wall anchor domain-containing protein [Nanoarchaeota archaeon]
MKAVKIVISILLLAIMVIPLVNAQVAVSSFTLNPQKVLPGSETNIDITLENIGDEDIENVIVTMDLSDVPFVPVGSSNEKIIEEIDDGSQEKVTFRVRALPDAQPSTYKIPVAVSYAGASKTSLISIEITANAHLDLLLEKSELVKVNDHGKVTLKFVNDGLAQIKNLKVALKESPLYQITSPHTLYIGEVDIGDFETEEFTIIPKAKDPILAVDLEYRDAANDLFKESKLIKIPVYTEEEAQQLGLVKSNATFMVVIAAIFLLLAAFLLYRRRKKRKNAL